MGGQTWGVLRGGAFSPTPLSPSPSPLGGNFSTLFWTNLLGGYFLPSPVTAQHFCSSEPAEQYRASAKGALAKGPFLLRGPIHRTRFSTGPIHCTCIFNLKKKIFFLFKFLLKIKKIFLKNF